MTIFVCLSLFYILFFSRNTELISTKLCTRTAFCKSFHVYSNGGLYNRITSHKIKVPKKPYALTGSVWRQKWRYFRNSIKIRQKLTFFFTFFEWEAQINILNQSKIFVTFVHFRGPCLNGPYHILSFALHALVRILMSYEVFSF